MPGTEPLHEIAAAPPLLRQCALSVGLGDAESARLPLSLLLAKTSEPPHRQ